MKKITKEKREYRKTTKLKKFNIFLFRDQFYYLFRDKLKINQYETAKKCQGRF